MTALPIPQDLEIHIEEIRKGWYRAFATVQGTTYAKASKTDVSWIAAACVVWRIAYGNLRGFDKWVAERMGLVEFDCDALPMLDDLDDFTIHTAGEQKQ